MHSFPLLQLFGLQMDHGELACLQRIESACLLALALLCVTTLGLLLSYERK